LYLVIKGHMFDSGDGQNSSLTKLLSLVFNKECRKLFYSS